MVVAIVEVLVLKMIDLLKNDEQEMEFLVDYDQILFEK
jgi:hypothetical protein